MCCLQAEIPCSYTNINGLSYIVREATKVRRGKVPRPIQPPDAAEQIMYQSCSWHKDAGACFDSCELCVVNTLIRTCDWWRDVLCERANKIDELGLAHLSLTVVSFTGARLPAWAMVGRLMSCITETQVQDACRCWDLQALPSV